MHTPAPWILSEPRKRTFDGAGEWYECCIHAGSADPKIGHGNALATVYLGGVGATSARKEEVMENARLIGAAPKMFAALEECHRALNVVLCGKPSADYFRGVKRHLKVATATSIEDNLAVNCMEIKSIAEAALEEIRKVLAEIQPKP